MKRTDGLQVHEYAVTSRYIILDQSVQFVDIFFELDVQELATPDHVA